jgi:carotenoid 1,2-hydratase
LNDSTASTWQEALALGETVPTDGYRWWYVDAISDDGRQGLTVIFFVGSVFSPYYAWRRRRGPAEPTAHVAVNVGLYMPHGRRWAMTERDGGALDRDAGRLVIGPSRLTIVDGGLDLDLDEVTAPLPGRLRGRVRLRADRADGRWFDLGTRGRHQWQPIAPCARVDVEFEAPGLSWSGPAYVDGNRGSEPLEHGFTTWQWCRATAGDGRTVVFYDYRERGGADGELALAMHPDGTVLRLGALPPVAKLPRTVWGIGRRIRSDRPAETALVRTLEDGPFYARSLVRTAALGEPLLAVHESLNLERFRRRLVQVLLPVRMPRRSS